MERRTVLLADGATMSAAALGVGTGTFCPATVDGGIRIDTVPTRRYSHSIPTRPRG